MDDLGLLVQALASLKVDTGVPADWFAALAAADIREVAAEWQQACRQYRANVEAQSRLLDLPAATEPGEAAERLEAAWSHVARTVPPGMSVHDLLPWAADLHGNAALLMEMHRVAAETAVAVGLTAPENLGDVAVAASALTLAAEPPQTVADFVTPELMRSESADIVASSAAAIRAARTRRAELDADYSIPPSVEPGLLRQHAAALAAAGLFGFMSPAVKAAKLCFAGLHRAPRKASKHAMAAALLSIAEHLEAAAAIEADPAARGAFGPAFRGLATDIDNALAAVGWATRVRFTLPQSGGVAASVSAVLLSGDPDRLRSLRALASQPDHGTLEAYLAQFPPMAASFADLAARLSEQAKCIETVATTCRDLGVPASTRASNLPCIYDALQATAKAGIAAHVPAALETALQGTCPAPLDEHASFDAALRLAFALDRLPLLQPMRKVLWLTSPEVLGKIVVPAAADAATALAAARKRWVFLKARLGLDEPKLLGRAVGATAPDQVAARLSVAASHSGELGSWILYLREREAAEAMGLKDLLRLWDDRVLPCSLATAFDRVFHHALVRAAFARHPELERFTGLGQQEARARFAALDAETASLKRQRLADELAKQHVPIGIGSSNKRLQPAILSAFVCRALFCSSPLETRA